MRNRKFGSLGKGLRGREQVTLGQLLLPLFGRFRRHQHTRHFSPWFRLLRVPPTSNLLWPHESLEIRREGRAPRQPARCHAQEGGMERMPRKEEAFLERIGPPGLDELQIASLVRAIDLVPDYRMSGVGEVHPDLV